MPAMELQYARAGAYRLIAFRSANDCARINERYFEVSLRRALFASDGGKGSISGPIRLMRLVSGLWPGLAHIISFIFHLKGNNHIPD